MTQSLSDKLQQGLDGLPEWKPRPDILCGSQIPKPMHGMAPRVVLGKKWWDETRTAAYASTGYRCSACGVSKKDAKGPKWLEGHELYDIHYKACRMIYVETVPLCHYCHNFIHAGRLEALRDLGKISQERFQAIIRHGEAILKAHKLRRPVITSASDDHCWTKWRLVIDDKEYPGLFKSMRDWLIYHAKKNGLYTETDSA